MRIALTFCILFLISACGIKATAEFLEGCEPTEMFVRESNPLSIHRVYDCTGVDRGD